MGKWLLSRRDRLIVARHEYVFSAGYPHGPKGPAVWTFRDSSASLNRFFLRKLRETYVPEGPEFGVWVDGIFHLESIRHAGLAATQIKLQASLRDADPMDSQPGDKSPGYYRVSLRDEGKAARRAMVLSSGLNGAKLSRIWDGFCPEGVKRVQPRFQPKSGKIIARRFDGRMVLSRRDSTIVARHEVPGIMRKMASSQRDD
jgi:hypothetical protein